MKMYKWESEALREYGQGHIIVCAESVEEARKMITDQCATILQWAAIQPEHLRNAEKDFPLLSHVTNKPYSLDSRDYSDEFAELVQSLKKFKDDVAGEPAEATMFLIRGSE